MTKQNFFCKKNIIVAAIILLALLLRGFFLNRFLEYDEIWTLQNYTKLGFSEIFQELATPNNHPLNTLIVKFLSGFSASNWFLRIGSLVFSIGSILLSGACARRICGKTAALYTIIALAVLPPFITAGATARGYSGQLFLLLLFCFCLLKCRKGNIFFTLIGAISAVLTIVSLPSSIVFLTVPGIFFLFTMWKSQKLQRIHIYSFGAALFFTFLWFFKNWYNFEQNQIFAVKITDFPELAAYLNELFHNNLVLLLPLVVMIFLKRHQRFTLLLTAMIFFPVLSTFVTGAAPARVYLPCAVPAVMLLAPQKTIKYYKLLFPAFLILQTAFSFPALPPKQNWIDCVKTPDTPGIIKVYGANESYVVNFNHPQARNKFVMQLSQAAAMETCSISFCGKTQVEGINNLFQTVSLPLDNEKKYGNDTVVMLKKSSYLPANSTAFLLLTPMPENCCETILQLFDGMELVKLNVWLTKPFYNNISGERFQYMLLAVRSNKARYFPKNLPLFVAVD